MKVGHSKKIRFLGLFCSVTIIASSICISTGINSSASVRAAQNSVVTEGETVLFECDYEKSNIEIGRWETKNSSRDFIPSNDPSDSANKVIQYKSSYYSEGALYLGSDFSSENIIKTAAIRPQAGETYSVMYDILTSGEYQNDFKLFLTAGNNSSDEGKITYDASNAVLMMKNVAGTTADTGGWEHEKTVTITFSENFDSEAYPYLMIYAKDGDGTETYIDNVKVHIVENTVFASSETLFECDYQKAPVETSNDEYELSSRDMMPKVDPLNKNNTVLKYTTAWFDQGALFLGSDFSSKNCDRIKNAAIKPVAGKTYDIEYDYYVAGKVEESEPPLRIYLTAGKSGSDGTVTYDKNNAVRLTEYERGTVFDMKEWERNRKASITFSSDFNADEYPYLIIYAEYGGRQASAYFDNVKVTAAALISGKTLFHTDYEDADITAEPWSLEHSSRDMLPKADPLDSNNTVMGYVPKCYDQGALIFGADFSRIDDEAVMSAGIKPEAGKTYQVDYDFLVTGNVSDKEPPLRYYLTAGKRDSDGKITYDENNAVQIARYEQGTVFNMTDWERDKKVRITFSSDFNAEEYPYFMIIAQYGGREAASYFDNVKVTDVLLEKSVYSKDCLLFCDDYENAVVYDESTAPGEANTAVVSGDLRPVKGAVSGNKYLAYCSNYYSLGTVALGYDYSADSKEENKANVSTKAVKVKPGVTYRVDYDYLIVGKTSSRLDIGLAVAKPVNDFENSTFNDGTFESNVLMFTTDIIQRADFYPDSSDTMIRKTTYITVPIDADLSTYNSLILYVKDGGQGACQNKDDIINTLGGDVSRNGVLFDNISVTALAGTNIEYKVDGETKTVYDSSGELKVDFMEKGNSAVKWYTDSDYKTAFIQPDYERLGVVSTKKLYGIRDISTVPFVKGDVNCDGEFGTEDMAALRKRLLGIEKTDVCGRDDVNGDNTADIRDLVKMKRVLAEDNAASETKIGGQAAKTYKFVTGGLTENCNKEIREIQTMCGMNDNNTNVISVNISSGIQIDSYIFEVGANSLKIVGRTEDSVIAALKMLKGFLNFGISVTSNDSVQFVYTGDGFSNILKENLNLVYEENFDTDLNYGGWLSSGNPYKTDWIPLSFALPSTGPDNKPCELCSDNIEVNNGILKLTATRNSERYFGAELRSKKFYSYGYFEIKAKIKSSVGLCNAFWLLGEDTNTVKYEVDIFEGFQDLIGSCLIKHTLQDRELDKWVIEGGFTYERLSKDPSPVRGYENVQHFFKGNWNEEYHTIGFDWQPTSLTWYIDDEAILTSKITEDQFNTPMQIILTQYSGRNILPFTGNADSTTDWENGNSLDIKYVRVYQYDLK